MVMQSTGKMVTFSIYIPKELRDWLKDEAEKQHRDFTELIRLILLEYRESKKPEAALLRPAF